MMQAIFPLYSRAAGPDGSRAQFHQIYERGLRAMTLVAFPAAMLFICAPVTLTRGLLGARYLASAPAMRLLGIAVWLLFVASPFPFVLTALNRQRSLFVTSAAGLVLRAALVAALTPRLSFLGPCWALIITETALVAMWLGELWKSGFGLDLVQMLWRPGLASLFMAAVIHFSNPQSLPGLIVPTMLGTAAYLLLIARLGAISDSELAMGWEGMHFPPAHGQAMVAAIAERIMKYLRCALALFCIPATLVLHWVAFPLSNKLSGVSFPIAGYVRGHTPPTLASYGVIAAAILLIAAVMLLFTGETNRRQRWTFIYAVGAAC